LAKEEVLSHLESHVDDKGAVRHKFQDIAGIVASMTEDDPGVETEKASQNILG
jgi:hypothetical protein